MNRPWIIAGVALTLSLFVLGGIVYSRASDEERRVRHILVATEADANSILDRIYKGEAFEDLCRDHSMDETTQKRGGDIGWIGEDSWPGVDRVFELDELGEKLVVESPRGWHVVEWTDRREKQESYDLPVAMNAYSTASADSEGVAETPAQNAAPPEPSPPTVEQRTKKSEERMEKRKRARRRRNLRNDDLHFELMADRNGYVPGEPIECTIRVTNRTDEPRQVFNPDLWCLGLEGRYQGRGTNLRIAKPISEVAAEDLGYWLPPRSNVERKFVLQDVAGEVAAWPTIRLIWRATDFYEALATRFAEEAAKEEHQDLLDRWYFNVSEPLLFNVLPIAPGNEQWYACFYIGRSSDNVWVRLEDPKAGDVYESWFKQVREGKLNDFSLEEIQSGEYIGGFAEQATPIALDSATARSVEPYSLVLARVKGADSDQVGGRVFFTLVNPDRDSPALPLGKVVLNKRRLDRLVWEERLQLAHQVHMVELYREDMVPTRIRRAMEAEVEADAKRKAEAEAKNEPAAKESESD